MKEKLTKKEINRLKSLGVKFINEAPYLRGYPLDKGTIIEMLNEKEHINKQRKR